MTCGGLCSSSCVKLGFSFDQNTTFLSRALRKMAHSSLNRTFERDTASENVSSRAQHDLLRRSMSPSDSSFTKVGRYGLTFKSFFMWSRIVYRGTPSSDHRFRVDFNGERSMEAATAARSQARCLSPTPRPVCNISKSERSFFPIQHCRPSWWSLIKPFPERSHQLGHGLSRVLSLVNLHTCHQALLDRVTACVSQENTTKFCGCGKSRVHYLGHCCPTIILHCTACCAVLCCVNLNWAWGAYSLGVRRLLAHPVYIWH